MPQRISDEDLDGLVKHSEHQLKIAELGKPSLYCFTDDLVLDLRDAREQLKTLKTYGEAKYAAETLLTELLKIAVKGLELVADQNDAIYPKQLAQTYLDRIKEKESST